MFKNQKCAFCDFEFEWIDSIFCPNCGNRLANVCTNAECEMNPNNENFDTQLCFPRNYKYCPECGSETTYSKALVSEEIFPPQKGQ